MLLSCWNAIIEFSQLYLNFIVFPFFSAFFSLSYSVVCVQSLQKQNLWYFVVSLHHDVHNTTK